MLVRLDAFQGGPQREFRHHESCSERPPEKRELTQNLMPLRRGAAGESDSLVISREH